MLTGTNKEPSNQEEVVIEIKLKHIIIGLLLIIIVGLILSGILPNILYDSYSYITFILENFPVELVLGLLILVTIIVVPAILIMIVVGKE